MVIVGEISFAFSLLKKLKNSSKIPPRWICRVASNTLQILEVELFSTLAMGIGNPLSEKEQGEL